jgi:hypothetical protein
VVSKVDEILKVIRSPICVGVDNVFSLSKRKHKSRLLFGQIAIELERTIWKEGPQEKNEDGCH